MRNLLFEFLFPAKAADLERALLTIKSAMDQELRNADARDEELRNADLHVRLYNRVYKDGDNLKAQIKIYSDQLTDQGVELTSAWNENLRLKRTVATLRGQIAKLKKGKA